MSKYHPWFVQLRAVLEQQPCVLVSLRQIMGSAPRESGCRMMVMPDAVHGSIGGGNLEFTAIRQARELLDAKQSPIQELQAFGLGPELEQCCGGAVSLLFEYLPVGAAPWLDALIEARATADPAVLASRVDSELPQHFVITANGATPDTCPDAVKYAAQQLLTVAESAPGAGLAAEQEFADETGLWWLERTEDQCPEVLLFGAGHVGQEVAQRIRGLPFRLTWVDQRPNIFPPEAAQFARLVSGDPVEAVVDAKPDSIFVVMTHSHQLDEDICHAILQRQGNDWDFRWLGLIGSATKRKRFVHRLKQRGISDEQLQRLVCPVGLAGINGKQPATIALSLLAQLMMDPAEEKH